MSKTYFFMGENLKPEPEFELIQQSQPSKALQELKEYLAKGMFEHIRSAIEGAKA